MRLPKFLGNLLVGDFDDDKVGDDGVLGFEESVDSADGGAAPLTPALSPSEGVSEAEAAAPFWGGMGGDYAPRRRRSIFGQGVQAGQFAPHKVCRNAISACSSGISRMPNPTQQVS